MTTDTQNPFESPQAKTEEQGQSCPATGCWKRSTARWFVLLAGCLVLAFGAYLTDFGPPGLSFFILPVVYSSLAWWKIVSDPTWSEKSRSTRMTSELFLGIGLFLYGIFVCVFALTAAVWCVEQMFDVDRQSFSPEHRIYCALLDFAVSTLCSIVVLWLPWSKQLE